MYMVAARVSTHLFIHKHSCFNLIATISVASRYEIMCDLDSLMPSVSKEVELEEEEIIGRRRYSARTIRRIREPLGSREEGAICRGNNTEPNVLSGSIKRYSDQSKNVIRFDWRSSCDGQQTVRGRKEMVKKLPLSRKCKPWLPYSLFTPKLT